MTPVLPGGTRSGTEGKTREEGSLTGNEWYETGTIGRMTRTLCSSCRDGVPET